MKRTAIALLVAIVMALPVTAYAQADSSTDQPADRVAQDGERDAGIRDHRVSKERALRAVDVRVAALDEAIVRVAESSHLTAAHQATLTADYRFHLDGLVELRGEIEAAETAEQLAPLVIEIVEEHWVFALQIPKGRLTHAADIIAEATATASLIGDEFAVLLAELEAAGVNVGEGWELLDLFNVAVQDAQVLAEPIPNTVLAIEVGEMPAAGTSLASARADIRAAHQLMLESRETARDLADFLRSVIDR